MGVSKYLLTGMILQAKKIPIPLEIDPAANGKRLIILLPRDFQVISEPMNQF